MSADLLYDESELLILFVLFGLLLLAGEAGYRLGRGKRGSAHPSIKDQVGSVQGALLGLFALLLGFTFSMALARFDVRKQMVVKESNAIGTAALRAQLLPVEQRAEAMDLFRRYVGARVEFARGPNLPTPDQQKLDADAMKLQDQLWSMVAAVAAADPHSVAAGLLVQSVNEVIDVKGERDAALANHVPESVLLLLFGFAMLTSGILGYGSGLAGARAVVTAAMLSILVTLVLVVIIDLDRPRRGLIRVSQSAMLQLQESLESSK